MTDADDRVYYVISDLHIGGDEQLEAVDFLDELLDFLGRLATTDENAELVINGDAFGLWEFTGIDGPEKFDVLEERYPTLFDQLRETGEHIPITLLPGNHDHELAAYDEYVDRFAEYNVDLVQDQSMTRPVGDHTIHFEHGNQHDPNNYVEDWGNPQSRPLGYYFNTHVVSRAGHLSDRGRFNWLKDVQAVTPTERMPSWLVSKYFYREMHPLLRYALLPFLLLFNISALLAILSGLDLLGLWDLPIDSIRASLAESGLAGEAVRLFLVVNVAVAGLILLLAIPLFLIRWDLRKTIDRFGLFETKLTVEPQAPFADAATNIFDATPGCVVFCYGHTHRPLVREVDGGALVNTGTWLKRLHRRDGVIGILPPVFYPSYQLAAVRMTAAGDGVTIEYDQVEKPSPSPEELTLTERLLTLGRTPDTSLPEDVVVSGDGVRPLDD